MVLPTFNGYIRTRQSLETDGMSLYLHEYETKVGAEVKRQETTV